MRTIWQGTDSLFLTSIPKFKKHKILYIIALRIFARLSDIFAQEHYACGELVERNLKCFGLKKPIKQYNTKVNTEGIKRVEHKEFNILYYLPNEGKDKFKNWLYGYDIFCEIKKNITGANFIVVCGNKNMSNIYPIIDLLIRPNRHDGVPRMVNECKELKIPYIWTNENPNVQTIINQIKIYQNEMV